MNRLGLHDRILSIGVLRVTVLLWFVITHADTFYSQRGLMNTVDGAESFSFPRLFANHVYKAFTVGSH